MKGNTKAILEFKGVSMNYHTPQGETLAVEDLSFSVYDGEFIAIIGPSGCGKTTVLSLSANLLKASSGEILIHGKKADKNNKNYGYMLQKDQLFPWRTIEKIIILPLDIRKSITSEN